MSAEKKKKPELMEVVIPITLNAVFGVKASSTSEAYKKAWDKLIEAMNLGFAEPGSSYNSLQEDDYVCAEVDGEEVDSEGNTFEN